MKLCIVIAAALASTCACQAELDTTRTVDSYASFGDAIYRETCQRVAYTGQLAQQAAGEIQRVDVSGTLGRNVCVAGDVPPDGAPPELFAIAGEHAELTATVNTILPQPFLVTLEAFLENILPLYDDGTMQNAIAGLGQLLGEMHDDPDFPAAWARIRVRHGYTPPAPGVIHDVLAYEPINDFITSFLGLIGPGGAAEPQWKALLAAGAVTFTTAEPEPDPAAPDRTLNLALGLLLHQSDPALGSGTPRWAVQRDVRGLAMVTTANGLVLPPFVDNDLDGLADVDASGHFVDEHGTPLAVPSPFPEPGVSDSAPRDSDGRVLTAPGSSVTLYQYFDLDPTVLAGVLREAPTILDANKDTALGLAWGATALLGPRMTQTRTYSTTTGTPLGSLVYSGFDLGQSPALDLLHGLVQLLGTAHIDQVLASTSDLLQNHESETSRVIGAMLDTTDRGKLHPEAQIPETSTLFDDLAPLIARTLAVQGLPTALIKALENTHVQNVAPMIAFMMSVNNQLDFDHSLAAQPAFPLISTFDPASPVDRSMPDSDYNRSLMQRTAHLVHDSNGAQFCNKDNATAASIGIPKTFAKCKLFEVDDLALFFALNMASDPIRMDASTPERKATTHDKASFREQITDPTMKALVADNELGDRTLQGFLKITNFTRFPTPQALARALFLRPGDTGMSKFLQDTTDPTLCTDGDRFIDVHDKSIFAWELPLPGSASSDNFYQAVQPLIDAFASFDECLQVAADGSCAQAQNAVKIFVDLLAVLHEHWASPQSTYFGHTYQHTDRTQPRFSFPDNVVSFEPLLTEVLGTSDLVPSLLGIAPVLDALTVPADDGTMAPVLALPILSDALRYVFDPQVAPPGLAYRNGQTTAVESDGTTPAGRVTPYYLIADGFAEKRAVLASIAATADGTTQANKWKAATSALVDQVLTVDKLSDTSWQFHNRRFHAITQKLISFVQDRVAAHTQVGDLASWVEQDLTGDLTDKLTGPVFAALGDLAAAIEHDDGARAQFYGLVNYLIDETGHDAVFRNGLSVFADQGQQFVADRDMVPAAHVIGKALDPAQNIANAQIALIKRSHDLDTAQALLTILRTMFEPGSDGVQPASNLADLITTVDRNMPGQTGDLSASDQASTMAALRDFFGDNQRGFLRFVAIVHNRNGQ